MKYNFSINTIPGNKIDLDLYSEAPSEPRSVVVIAHGFKGFKDWGFFPHAGDYFAHAGYHCVIFNFSHNGITPGNDIFDEPEKFADNTASLELSELIEVVRRVVSNEFCKFNGDLFIIGHSRGGGIAMLAAPHIAELTALGLWSAISYTDRFTERQKEVARSVGYLEVPNSRTGQILRMNRSFFEDIEANKEGSLSIVKTLAKTDVPVIVVHGEVDGTVLVSEANFIYSNCKNQKSELVIIPKSDHTFKMVHPSQGVSEHFAQVLEKTNNFFRIHKRG